MIIYHQHRKIGDVTGHAEDGGLEIFLVTGQIDESDDFGGSGANLDPIQWAVIRLVDHITAAVETQDVVAHRRRSSRFDFVFVTEQFLTG